MELIEAALTKLRRTLRRLKQGGEGAHVRNLKPEGKQGIEALGHREYVGGVWEELGRLQFRFLVDAGLRPEHHFLDVGCGALRGGVLFIPYLDPGHYMGVDRHVELLERGVIEELGETLFHLKRPRLVATQDFEFTVFRTPPHFALAQSLFTHLTPERISLCLARLSEVMPPDGRFYATFFESSTPSSNPRSSHDHAAFSYTREEMRRMGGRSGWRMTYIGDWGHPRRQQLVCYTPGSE